MAWIWSNPDKDLIADPLKKCAQAIVQVARGWKYISGKIQSHS